MKYFTAEEILLLHYKIVEDFGGAHGIRDDGRLKSALLAPRQTVFGHEAYPTLFDKAAVYMRGVIADHPFIDGNKRTGTVLAGLFIKRGGHELAAKPKDLEDFAVRVAVERLAATEIAAWLKSHSQKSSTV